MKIDLKLLLINKKRICKIILHFNLKVDVVKRYKLLF